MNAIILYHANAKQRYPQKWIDDCVGSIKNQTEKCIVLEMDYAGGEERLCDTSIFYSTVINHYQADKKTFRHTGHSYAHNMLCKLAVEQRGADYVFNTNLDDFYHYQRVEKQLEYLREGYDVVSSNMTQIDGDNRVLRSDIRFSDMDIEEHAKKGHNVISHPVCAYSKNFILNSGLLNPYDVPKDDMMLWGRSFGKFKFVIAPWVLHYYRLHLNNVSKKQ